MFYAGADAPAMSRIGLAASSDGLIWVKQGESDGLIIDRGQKEWDSVVTGCPSPPVRTPEGKWRLYYAGRKDTIHKYHAIGMAELSD
jgi:predicted GH43/DUF377 family glycosyl hydrolase